MNHRIHTLLRSVIALAIITMSLINAPVASSATISTGTLNWSVQYLIDQSQNSQFNGPRDNRGLALSPDGRYLYAGYNNPSSGINPYQVRKIDTGQPDYNDATIAVLNGFRGKAIATDDLGRVYLAEGTNISIYNADLNTPLFTISGLNAVEGVAVTREGSDLALYATDRTSKTLTRWALTEDGSNLTGATQAGLGGSGQILVAAAVNLRGVEVDPSGKIWMADYGGNKVFRVNNDGTGLAFAAVTKPIDIGFDDAQAFVTQYTARTISVLQQSDMSIATTLTPPWADLKLDPDGQSAGGALSGIAMGPGSFFYVANEAGQTANEKSTYGRTDEQSGFIGSESYTDLTHDDNDPILKIAAPNQPPVADANGPYLVAVGQSVVLDGSGSFDPDGDPLTETWIETGLPTLGTIIGSTFTAGPAAGITEVTLTVDDGMGGMATDSAMLVVYDPSGGFVTGGGWIMSPEGAMTSFGAVWDQDFSIDDSGWLDDDDAWYGDIAVAGGAATFFGSGGSGPFSRFDGYRSTWPGTWIAEIDVYLDPAWPTGQGFDYSVAANGSDNSHQRDFIFHVGVVEDYGPITGRALLVNGSNNADFYTNPYKLVYDNGGNYYNVTAAGWYTLQHVFRNAGGHLAVDLNLVDSSGTILWTATRENAADTIPGEVGGNRYAWFTHIDVTDGIQVDNHQLFIDVPSPEGKATFGFVSKYKKGASVPEGNTEFQFKAGDLNFHSTSYDWLVVTGSNYAKFKGTGTINGQGAYKFQIWAADGSPDKFRIKIWWEETDSTEHVVYDNGTDQPIGGGSIVVHTK